MSAAATALKLSHDPSQETAFEPVRLVPAEPAPSALEIELARLQQDLVRVQTELAELRHRDQVLQFYTQRLDEELKLAARVQQDFLPKTLPQVGRVRFSVLFRPAGFVSGDLYDVMRLDETNVGIYMADAVGHGMPAALLTMFLKQALVTKEILPTGYRLLTPGQAMERLNDALVAQNLSQATFATAVYATLDTRSLTLTVARGGHPTPIRMNAGGEVQSLEAEGSLLGIFPNEKFEEYSVQLEPGDRVFLFTDGVEVAFGGERTLDATQWAAEIHARRELSTASFISDLARLVDSSTPLKDDLTMIVLEVEPA
jgi:sigma-B regulation protein RsbU (phosphoserine phosphatase)